ncbi:MAG TPA: ABC transporter substrate-binding protein [Bradyrhizobium sp.]|nr:ABC transporter substrate-binding protein [Bradyrhizobium sp.]
MRRREFIALLGGAAVAWPLAARAQQPVLPSIGFFNPGSAAANGFLADAFRRGLAEAGYVEGRNVTIEYRWADGRYDRLAALAAEFIHRRVSVIAACGSSAPGLAAKAATSTIPIVFQTGGDPVLDGLVASMNRPGGNVTGVSRTTVELEPKRLELLREAAPKATLIAVLLNPGSPHAELLVQRLQEATRSLGLGLAVMQAGAASELEDRFAAMVQQGAGALLVPNDPSMIGWAEQIAALAVRHEIPTMFGNRVNVVAGGLMSYDASVTDSYRQVGVYAGRVLKGEKPADLPIVQPTRFEFVINLKTAKALKLAIPESFLLRADEMID